jgi:hypothetical protein
VHSSSSQRHQHRHRCWHPMTAAHHSCTLPLQCSARGCHTPFTFCLQADGNTNPHLEHESRQTNCHGYHQIYVEVVIGHQPWWPFCLVRPPGITPHRHKLQSALRNRAQVRQQRCAQLERMFVCVPVAQKFQWQLRNPDRSVAGASGKHVITHQLPEPPPLNTAVQCTRCLPCRSCAPPWCACALAVLSVPHPSRVLLAALGFATTGIA